MKHPAALACICASLVAAAAPQPAWAQSDEMGRCGAASSGPDEWIPACTEIIDSHSIDGRTLATALAQRGYAYTLKRQMAEAEKAPRLSSVPTSFGSSLSSSS